MPDRQKKRRINYRWLAWGGKFWEALLGEANSETSLIAIEKKCVTNSGQSAKLCDHVLSCYHYKHLYNQLEGLNELWWAKSTGIA
jgi:hypothetical protein